MFLLLHGTVLFIFHCVVIKRQALKQQHYLKSSLQHFDFGCLSFRVVKLNATLLSKCTGQIEQSYFTWNQSLYCCCSGYFTISTFLTQVASKCCRSMQLFGPILNFLTLSQMFATRRAVVKLNKCNDMRVDDRWKHVSSITL